VSRADRLGGAIRLGTAVRDAAWDFWTHSVRLVPANIIWGAALLALFVVALQVGPLAFFALLPLLAIPLAGVVRLAALAARRQDVVLSDAFAAYRRYVVPALVGGAIAVATALVFLANVFLGAKVGGPLGWAFATLAGWGLLATWVGALPFFVLLVDPAREHVPAARKVRLVALLVVAAPGRMIALGALLALILVPSAIAFAALITISVAFASLVAARFILPLADALEASLAATAAQGAGRELS
jgi:hypothetical protein